MGDLANRLGESAASVWNQPAPPVGTVAGRTELLRLAAWFDAADAQTAHALFTATFRLHAAHWLAGDPDDPGGSARGGLDSRQPPRSWWAPATHAAGPMPMEQREPDDAAGIATTRDHLRAQAEAESHWRRTAAAEVRETLQDGTSEHGSTELNLSQQGRELLAELLAAALGAGISEAHTRSAGDLEFDIRLQVTPAVQAEVVVRDPVGELRLHGLQLRASTWGTECIENSRSETP